MTPTARAERRSAVAEMKRSIILEAALRVFESAGLDGASMRAIAQEAGYTAGAIYSHFPSKEHIYAAALRESLDRLRAAIEHAAAHAVEPPARFVAAGLAFFDFYATNPRDLDLGFYLFGRGIRPRGLSAELDRGLNGQLLAALRPLVQAAADHGVGDRRSRVLAADALAHASGLLLLAHTRRLELFDCPARDLMREHLDRLLIRC
jgi:AcrR family transcriptional regulator